MIFVTSEQTTRQIFKIGIIFEVYKSNTNHLSNQIFKDQNFTLKTKKC